MQRTLQILSVEDSLPDFVLLRESIEDLNLEGTVDIDRAKTCSEAIEKVSSSKVDYDVVFLDLSLPDSDGIDSFRAVHLFVSDLPIIVLSGFPEGELSLELIKAGAQDFLPKDEITPSRLMRSLSFAIARQEARVEQKRLNERLQKALSEVNELQLQLIQAEKLEALGRLAAGVAHEVRNPLGAINMGVAYLHSILDEIARDDVELVVNEIESAVTRADRIIQGMLELSRSEELKIESISVNDCVRKALHLAKLEWSSNKLKFENRIKDELPNVEGDLMKLEQVVLNLLVNAIHALESQEDGRVTVSTYGAEIDTLRKDEGSRLLGKLREGDSVVVIEIKDNGPGVPSDKLNKIFEPFYTTKATGKGTGLGLSVCRKIVELHQGELLISNRDDRSGLCCRVILKSNVLPRQNKKNVSQANRTNR